MGSTSVNAGAASGDDEHAPYAQGTKAGAITLLGDAFKCVIAVLVVRMLFAGKYPDMRRCCRSIRQLVSCLDTISRFT